MYLQIVVSGLKPELQILSIIYEGLFQVFLVYPYFDALVA